MDPEGDRTVWFRIEPDGKRL